MASADSLVTIIEKKSKMGKDKINDMVDDKYAEFGGMITREAAAHLVAKTIGIELPKSIGSKLQIKNLMTGMRGVNLVGRIFKISPVNEFQKKNGDKGKVANVFVSDGTGYTRVPLWNDQVRMVEEEVINVGDAVEVINAMTKENVYGEVEIMIGKFGGLKIVEDDEGIPSLENVNKSYVSDSRSRSNIADLVPGKSEIRGTVVQVFRGKFIFGEGNDRGLVISCVIDDGTADIRVVFFRELAEKVSGAVPSDLEEMGEQARLEAMKKVLIGKELVISGNVKKNDFFKALELIADSATDLNPLEESKKLVEEVEAKIGG